MIYSTRRFYLNLSVSLYLVNIFKTGEEREETNVSPVLVNKTVDWQKHNNGNLFN